MYIEKRDIKEEYMKRIIIFVVLLSTMLFASSCAQVMDGYNEPVDIENEKSILVEIPRGSSTTGIANILIENELIKNVNAFKLKSKSMEADGKMKAGQYMLSQAMSAEDIILKLVSGDVYEDNVKFTIPEGYEVRQIIDKLEAENLIDRELFIKALENAHFEHKFLEGVDRSYRLEGYLFPDTYIIKNGASEEEIISKMLSRFNEVFKKEYYARADELGMSITEVVTLASIIERESKLSAERPLVSSVFHNRIKKNMLLQSCATIQYVLMERKDRLTYADLEVVSPFNTYKNTGLTPAPIASPGEESIIAALYPADTNFLFFVTTEKNDGSHYFNETLAGHNRDKEKGKVNN